MGETGLNLRNVISEHLRRHLLDYRRFLRCSADIHSSSGLSRHPRHDRQRFHGSRDQRHPLHVVLAGRRIGQRAHAAPPHGNCVGRVASGLACLGVCGRLARDASGFAGLAASGRGDYSPMSANSAPTSQIPPAVRTSAYVALGIALLHLQDRKFNRARLRKVASSRLRCLDCDRNPERLQPR